MGKVSYDDETRPTGGQSVYRARSMRKTIYLVDALVVALSAVPTMSESIARRSMSKLEGAGLRKRSRGGRRTWMGEKAEGKIFGYEPTLADVLR